MLAEFISSVKFTTVKRDKAQIEQLGYNWDDLKQMRGNEEEESVLSFICQMMELFEPDKTKELYMRFWEPILEKEE